MRMYELVYFHVYHPHTHFAKRHRTNLCSSIYSSVRSHCSQNIYLLNSIKLINVAWCCENVEIGGCYSWWSRQITFFGQHQRAFNMLNCFLAVKSFFSVNPFVCLIPINTTTIIIYVSFSPTIGIQLPIYYGEQVTSTHPHCA